MPDLILPVAAESLLGRDLLVPLGGLAAVLTIVGLVLLVPIYMVHRREVKRLTTWMELDPDAGTREFAAITSEQLAAAGMARPAGPSAAAERVTSERPALERIGTGEHPVAISQLPFWRRVIERGPRHPLVISILALLVAAGIVVGVGSLLRPSENEGGGKALQPSDVEVLVLNASSEPGLASSVADSLEADEFVVLRTSVADESARKTVVRFAPGARREARLVARQFGATKIKPFDRKTQAAADGASVVVLAGEDLAKAQKGSR